MNANTIYYWDAKTNNQIILAPNATNPSCFPMDTALLTNANPTMITDVSLASVASTSHVTSHAKRFKTDALRPTKEYVWTAYPTSN